MNTTAYLPRWTKRVPLGTGGRDPLGLSRITHYLTGELLRGVITTTWYARYYSIYCWILDNLAKTESSTDSEDFAQAFRRREAAFAYATLLDEDRRVGVAPVGVTKARAQLEDASKTLDLDARLLGHDYGGFGQNYGGSMYDLGLWAREDEFEEITGETAELLAMAVEDTLSRCPYGKKRGWEQGELALKVLEQSAGAMSLDALHRPGHEVERDALVDLLFSLHDRPMSESDERRRLTLAWILWVIRAYVQAQLNCRSGKCTEWALLYAPLYFGVINHGEDAIVELEPPAALVDNSEHWRLFCAQQYLTHAHEGALAAMLEMASLNEQGLELAEAVELLVTEPFQAFIDERVGALGTSPARVLAALGLSEVPSIHDSAQVNAARSIIHPLSENKLCDEAKGPEQLLAQAMLQLASLYARWRALPDNAATRWLRRDGGDEPWVGNRLRWIDAWWAEDYTWEQAVGALLEVLVDRHQEVLWDKQDMTKCWLEFEEGRVRQVRELSPGFRSSRFLNAVSMLRNLGLVTDGDELSVRELEAEDEDEDDAELGLHLTPLGERLLARLEESWS